MRAVIRLSACMVVIGISYVLGVEVLGQDPSEWLLRLVDTLTHIILAGLLGH